MATDALKSELCIHCFRDMNNDSKYLFRSVTDHQRQSVHAMKIFVAVALVFAGLLVICGCAKQSNRDIARSITKTWELAWGGPGDDSVLGLDLDENGNSYVSGGFHGLVDFDPGQRVRSHKAHSDEGDAFLASYDAEGSFRWLRTWGGDGDTSATCVAVDREGNVVVVGRFEGAVDFDPGPRREVHQSAPDENTSSSGSFLVKYGADGRFRWARSWSGGSVGSEIEPCGAYSVDLDSEGCIYVTGSFAGSVSLGAGSEKGNASSKGGQDIYLAKWDSVGDFQWLKTWGGEAEYEIGYAVRVHDNDAIYVAGFFGESAEGVDFSPVPSSAAVRFSNGGLDAFVSRFQSDGDFEWVRTWGNTAHESMDIAYGLVSDTSGSVYVTGCFDGRVAFNGDSTGAFRTSLGDADVFVVSFDEQGLFRWVKTWGGSGTDIGMAIEMDGNSMLGIAGVFTGEVDFDPRQTISSGKSQGKLDVFLSAFTSEGQFITVSTWGSNDYDEGKAVRIDQNGYRYFGGYFSDTIDFNAGASSNIRSAYGGTDCFLLRLQPLVGSR